MVQGGEPLGRGPEDHRLLAAPAVRVGVGHALPRLVEQGAVLGHSLDDVGVGFEHMAALILGHVGGEAALVVQGGVDVEAVLLAGAVVLLAVARGGVHAAGARLQGDVVGEHEQRLAVDEGVLAGGVLRVAGVHLCELLRLAQATGRVHGLGQVLGHDQRLAGRVLVGHVGVAGVQGDAQVGGQRPGGGGPDDEGDLLASQLRRQGRRVPQVRELDVDGGGVVVLVLHLGFGQRGAAAGAPVHRLLALVQVPLVGELGQLPGDGGLVLVGHGEVRLVPAAEDAQALELLALDVHMLLRVVAALEAEGQLVHLPGALLTQVAHHLQLDGQAVAVPARHIHRPAAAHGLVTHHDVLEHLVQDVPVVDVAVGVRGAVMEYKGGPLLARVFDLAVDVLFLPPLEHLGLALGHLAAHGERGLGEVQGSF